MSTMPSTANSRRFEVWGSPIHHSRSPQLHSAAYRVLGLDWQYGRQDVTAAQLAKHFATLAPQVRGLSLTMPLKEAILHQVSDHRGPVNLLQAANTAVRGPDGWWLDNTDWWGAWRTIGDAGGSRGQHVWLLGAGATARAVLFALAQDVPGDLSIVVRSPERAQATEDLASALGLHPRLSTFDELPTEPADWVISTLPGGAAPDAPGLADQARHAKLFDIAYDPWPSALAQSWAGSPHPVVSGTSMLVYQALAQLRNFVHGDNQRPLDQEAAVLDAMWRAIDEQPLEDAAQPSVKQ